MQGLYPTRAILWIKPIRIIICSVVLACVVPSFSAFAELKFKDLTLTPSLTVSERYDSNVLFTSGGQDKDDFVTIVSPGLSASYKGREIGATLSGGMSLSSYAKHSDLNYVAAFGSLNVDLTELVHHLDKRARLQIADSVYYTPELPAFVTSTVGLSPFSTGIQPQRVRSFSNASSATGGYTVSSRVEMNAGYSYSTLNFGNAVGGPIQTSLFRTTLQGVNAGPDVKLTTADTLNLQYLYTKADFNGGAVPGFHTQGGTAGITHVFTPQLSAKVAGGATVISPSNRVAPLGSLLVTWSERSTTTTLSASRSVSPSFIIAATSLETTLVSLTVTHQVTERLRAGADANYARSSSAVSSTATSGTSGSNLSFDSYGADFTLSYSITRWLSSSFAYSHFHFTQGFTNATSSFNRDLVTISLTATWL